MEQIPENIPLFGGLAGASLDVDQFEVCEGLVLRRTYQPVAKVTQAALRALGPIA